MKSFLDEEFLLQTDTAIRLYQEFAEGRPLIDYHSHLNPRLIAEDYRFRNLTEAWLYGDHYKWRAMRANGIPERYITGDASDEEKFLKWAETVPNTLGNPLYHWTHLELQRYFGITELLTAKTAGAIYEKASSMLQQPEYSIRKLLEMMNVEVVCTTDDPADNLEYHRLTAASGWKVKVLPTWRPDRILGTSRPSEWNRYIDLISERSGIAISAYDDLLQALRSRQDFFHENGCRLSDHGLETFYADAPDRGSLAEHFRLLREETGESLPQHRSQEALNVAAALLEDLARLDAEKGWVQQFHLGALRSTNTRGLRELGPDTGFDSLSDLPLAGPMARFLDRLELDGKLAKTILYNLNPASNEVVASMTGNFQDGSVPGKIQWGSAWWFLDQKTGIENQIRTLADFGLLSRFVGMLTDSRSFLSYPRHEYFRRILCNFIGERVEQGEWPADRDLLGRMVEDICHRNARNYFNF